MKKNIKEVKKSDISVVPFRPKEKLNPLFFNEDGVFDSRIRLQLLDIADDFIEELNVKWVKPKDIVITGSIVNYNWNMFSDVDIHIIYNYNEIYSKKEFVKDYFDSKKNLWNKDHDKLKIKGYPVEISIENESDPGESSGIYSLEKNDWVKEPKNMDKGLFDESYVKKVCAKAMTKLDELFDKVDKEKDKHKLKKLSDELYDTYDELHEMRKKGLSTKEKELSNGNIIWKVIKHAKYIDKIWEYINKCYDIVNTIKEKKNRKNRVIILSEGQGNFAGNCRYLSGYLKEISDAVKYKFGKKDLPKLHTIIQPYYFGAGYQLQDGKKYWKDGIYTVLSNPSCLRELKSTFGIPDPSTDFCETDIMPMELTEPEIESENDIYIPDSDMEYQINNCGIE